MERLSFADPGWLWVYYLRAQALVELGRTAEAQADLTKGLELNPVDESREQMEQCYGDAVRSFYTSKNWRRRIARRSWVCRHSFYIFLRHLPQMLKARRLFDSRTPALGK